MPDKDRIIELLDSYGVGGSYAYDLCDEIDECYAFELEKARKWDKHKDALIPVEEYKNVLADAEKWMKVSSLVEGDCNSCKSLRYCEKNDIHPCEILKDALEG